VGRIVKVAELLSATQPAVYSVQSPTQVSTNFNWGQDCNIGTAETSLFGLCVLAAGKLIHNLNKFCSHSLSVFCSIPT